MFQEGTAATASATASKRGNVANLKPFKKGQSGNPKGRRVETEEQKLQKLIRKYADKAVNAYVDCLDDPDAPHSAKIQAATALLDRGFGKPKQEMDLHATVSIDEAFEGLLLRLNAARHGAVIDADAEEVPMLEAAE